MALLNQLGEAILGFFLVCVGFILVWAILVIPVALALMPVTGSMAPGFIWMIIVTVVMVYLAHWWANGK